MGAFRDALNKKLIDNGSIGNSIKRPLLSTGIDWFDYMNATFTKAKNGEISFEAGLKQGAIATFIGPSGSGKSTDALTSAINILKENDEAVLYIYDVEKSNSHERCRALVGCSQEEYDSDWKENRIFIINTLTTTENLQNLIDDVYAQKMDIGANLKMTKADGRFSAEALKRAKEIRDAATNFPPTIIMIDSLAALAPMAYTGSTNSVGQRDGMANAQIAKANNALIKGSSEKCFEGNIMLFIVNHIQVLISTDMYGGDKRPLKFLKQDETLPGGKDAIFLSDFTIRLDQGKKIVPGKELDLKGFIQKATLVKSRNNASGIDVELVFDQYHGVNNTLTNYLLLKANDKIGGGGQGFFLKAYPEVKFKQADLEKLYNSDEDFATAFDEEAHKLYQNTILEMSKTSSEAEEDSDADSEEDGEMTVEDVIAEIKACKGPKGLKKLCLEYGFEIEEDVFTKDIAIAKKHVINYVKENF